jgi:hypothetical protein
LSLVPLAQLSLLAGQEHGRTIPLPDFSKLEPTSGVVVELAQRNSYLTGKINERYNESPKGSHEENGNPALVLNCKEGARKCDDHKYRHRNDDSPEDCPVQHRRTPHQAWKVDLKPMFGGVGVRFPFNTIVLSTILFRREIRIAINAAIAPSRNAGAAAREITCES